VPSDKLTKGPEAGIILYRATAWIEMEAQSRRTAGETFATPCCDDTLMRKAIEGAQADTRMKRPLVHLAVGLVLSLVICSQITAQGSPAFSIRFGAGGNNPYTDQNGHLYLPDQEWTPQTQAGYIGGRRMSYGFWQHIDGTPDEDLHKRQRLDWQEYRFSSVPNGDYLVTLSFSKIGTHPYTVFGVNIEGQAVLENFNIPSLVGCNYALNRRFAVTVADGELNVVSVPIVGEPRLSTIEVQARSPDAVPPATPAELTTTSSYDAVLLDWTDSIADDLDGYHVYRARSPDGPYGRLTAKPVYVSHYQDAAPDTHTTYYYRVSAVDVYDNESDPTTISPGVALDKSDATLPLYELAVPRENLLVLESDPGTDDEVTGTLRYRGLVYPIEIRYRGSYGRWVNKKSWKIKFIGNSPFPGQDEINIRADYSDWSLMRSKLATDLLEAVGIQPLRAAHCLLMLNGEYLGVHTCVEQMDENFLRRTGRDPDISIYKVIRTSANDFSRAHPSTEDYYQAFQKKTNTDTDYSDIIDLIQLINYAPDETFAYRLRSVFDVTAYLDYYAVIVLTNNADFVPHNAYFLHDLNTDRWELVPYDLDRAFSSYRPKWGIPYNNAIDMGSLASPTLPWGFSSMLLTRVLDVPQFRAYYCHRLAEFMETVFSDATMHPLIDATYAAIEEDGLRDWHKYRREDNEWFTASPDELKTYVTERKYFLWGEMPDYCPADRPYLNINEIMANNQSVLEDPDESGEFPAWVEIYNAGLETMDLSGMYLTNDLADPTKFQIADGIVVPAGGFITFFADGDPEQGPLHTNFRLDRTGGQIGMFSGAGQIDVFTFGSQAPNLSRGRHPDGVDDWISFNVPTPGSSNLLLPPAINATTRIPLSPGASDAVTVTATIVDDGALLTTTLHYSATGSGFIEVPMANLRESVYIAQIPPQPDGSLVEYLITAGDNDGQTSTAPHEAPSDLYRYTVGHHPPALFINEFMADNETVLADPDEPGEFPDWIELYNPGPGPIDLGGRYLTDDLDVPTKFRIADGLTIPAGGFALFYADSDPEQGPFHTNFRLDKDGESVGLFDVNAAGNPPIDTHTFGAQATDVSACRYPNGGGTWAMFHVPSPGMASIAGTYLPVVLKRTMY
jgi:spore coat protein CotH